MYFSHVSLLSCKLVKISHHKINESIRMVHQYFIFSSATLTYWLDVLALQPLFGMKQPFSVFCFYCEKMSMALLCKTDLFLYSQPFSFIVNEDAHWRPDCQLGLTGRPCHLIKVAHSSFLDDVLLYLQSYPSGKVMEIGELCGIMHLPLLM